MAFDLKRVLKVMLFASNGPLSVKDIQTAISRFHDQAEGLPLTDGEGEGETALTIEGEAAAEQAVVTESTAETPDANEVEPSIESSPIPPGAEPLEAPVALLPLENNEFYVDVPSLVTTTQIREAMDLIAAELRAQDSDVVVLESGNGWRLATHPRFARWVRLLRNEPTPVRLTASALETLAVVAYRQPVTRAEIEQIRGVSAEAGVAKLLERDLVYVTGRADQPGRPLQFGTTDAFLEFVGIKSLDELPASDVLSPRQIDAWLQTSANPRPASDADMGLDEHEADQLTLNDAPVPEAPAVESEIESEPEAPSAAPESEQPASEERPAN
ncbi:SMC-Scp complex subunit ScpB [Oleiharenicola lentus]|uniref:SMC-Scp complex subunit ScpB n=1 Tax=Oleiharenicola lentus TaxID=2508720 RepID=UPI003F66C93A